MTDKPGYDAFDWPQFPDVYSFTLAAQIEKLLKPELQKFDGVPLAVAQFLWSEGCQFRARQGDHTDGFEIDLGIDDGGRPCLRIQTDYDSRCWPEFEWYIPLDALPASDRETEQLGRETAEQLAVALEALAKSIREQGTR